MTFFSLSNSLLLHMYEIILRFVCGEFSLPIFVKWRTELVVYRYRHIDIQTYRYNSIYSALPSVCVVVTYSKCVSLRFDVHSISTPKPIQKQFQMLSFAFYTFISMLCQRTGIQELSRSHLHTTTSTSILTTFYHSEIHNKEMSTQQLSDIYASVSFNLHLFRCV